MSIEADDGAARTTRFVRAAIDGDPEATGWIVRRFTPLLLVQARTHLRRLTKAPCEPEDLVQEAWMIAFGRLDRLVPRDGRFTPVLLRYLGTTLLHRYNKVLEAEMRSTPVPPVDAPELADPSLRDAVSVVIAAEAQDEVMDRLARLSPEDREMVVLRYLEDASNRLIAEKTGLKPNTVAVRLRRSLDRLREGLPESLFHELTSS